MKLSLYITCGLPILSTGAAGIADLIKQYDIGLVSNFPDMTGAMKELAENDKLRQRLADNCRRIREDFYFDNIYKKALAESMEKL